MPEESEVVTTRGVAIELVRLGREDPFEAGKVSAELAVTAVMLAPYWIMASIIKWAMDRR